MGKLIYWIDVLNKINLISSFVGVLLFVITITTLCCYFDSKEKSSKSWLTSCSREEYKAEAIAYKKAIKVSVILLVICGVLAVFIPGKSDMYAIALTKDIEVGQIYELSKEELKSGIDYFFEKLDSLNK